MVDPESIDARLSRLGELLDQLERIHAEGRAVYAEDFRVRLAVQHALQLAIQTCIDVGAHLIAERNIAMPSDYRGVFSGLERLGLDRRLATRMGRAAGLRNILVHDYLELDDDLLWTALENLDDLRGFATFVNSILS
jgi:uncharacterized protein YutE (UPF0331/DUF86 family)